MKKYRAIQFNRKWEIFFPDWKPKFKESGFEIRLRLAAKASSKWFEPNF